MFSYNGEHVAYANRIHKELWTKDELKDFGSYCNSDTIRARFGLQPPKNYEQVDMRQLEFKNKLKQQKRIAAVKAGVNFEQESAKGSAWSAVPPSPKAANEKLIWKSNAA